MSVVHAEPGRAFSATLELHAGATVAEAIARSGIREQRRDVDIDAGRLGIFARKATFETVLHDGDRVEIYRALKIDPKEARRNRARKR
ncbi:MAG TPA: RnfH family protein [Rhodanobacteraceae bacterium]|nr:RnfH family protein [Rhodanobacteraceae bacterium]